MEEKEVVPVKCYVCGDTIGYVVSGTIDPLTNILCSRDEIYGCYEMHYPELWRWFKRKEGGNK